MSSDARKSWAFEGDLESYSFDDFYQKNDSPIQDEAGFGIDLSADHIPFQCEHGLIDTRMETIQSDNSRTAKETEDNFFLEDLASSFEPLHRPYEDPPNFEPEPENASNDQTSKQTRQKKIKKARNPRKNQYDKNIFANINAVILKKIVAPEAVLEVKTYCQHHQVCFEDFHSYFLKLERSKFRLGTTQLSNFYQSQEVNDGWKQVFGMFCVRFLREEYVQYVLREGRMQEKEKYLSCATKMMYIPRLRKEEYHIISCLVNKVIDI